MHRDLVVRGGDVLGPDGRFVRADVLVGRQRGPGSTSGSGRRARRRRSEGPARCRRPPGAVADLVLLDRRTLEEPVEQSGSGRPQQPAVVVVATIVGGRVVYRRDE